MRFPTSDVVVEEMLHLCLAGNALLAVGGTPKLYHSAIIPAYPTPMLGRTPELILHLRKMTKENLQTYIDVYFMSLQCRTSVLIYCTVARIA